MDTGVRSGEISIKEESTLLLVKTGGKIDYWKI
jgi:hypothetical protein